MIEGSKYSASTPSAATPPVGLSWAAVSAALQVDLDVLEREGSIVLAGEYFPDAGYALDPTIQTARRVDVGDRALQPAYFLGKLTLGSFSVRLPPTVGDLGSEGVVVQADRAPIIGLFSDHDAADRAAQQILQGSIGGGVAAEDGPLGVELHVRHSDMPGRVASVIASLHGAVISVGGQPVETRRSTGPLATGTGIGEGDARRGGTGAAGGSYGREPAPLQTEIPEQ
ncbi:MAG: hypothetical protein ACR2GA_03615 [Chloroflexota bacterium]